MAIFKSTSIIIAGGKISTTGTGFRGGALFTTTGRTTTTLYSCVSLDVGTNKGESIAGFDTDDAMQKIKNKRRWVLFMRIK